MDDILLTEVADGVAIVTLNRPRQMNALSSALRRRFGEALAALGADDAVRAGRHHGGFVRVLNAPRMEDGTSRGPGLLTYPNKSGSGLITAKFDNFNVKTGDRFQALIGCEYRGRRLQRDLPSAIPDRQRRHPHPRRVARGV